MHWLAMQYKFLYISYDIYVALVSLVACLRPCNINFHNETLNCFSSSHLKPMQTDEKNDLPATIISDYFFLVKNLIKL